MSRVFCAGVFSDALLDSDANFGWDADTDIGIEAAPKAECPGPIAAIITAVS